MEKYKAQLEEEKKLLEEELKSLGKFDSETGEWNATADSEIVNQEVSDEADMADRAEDYEERVSKIAILEKKLEDVNHAIDKIGNGSYGICEKCGKQIEEARLEANSSAKLCEVCMNS